jgi:UPF0716 protein FxsA
MFLRLFILFTLVPIVELALLIRIGRAISVGPTLAIVVLTGIVGAALARWQGLKALTRIQSDLAAGVMPTALLVDGLLILLAGALLVTPGVLTDAVGLSLLIPPARRSVRRGLRRWFEKRFIVVGPPSGPRTDGPPTDFVDVEAREVSPPPESTNP